MITVVCFALAQTEAFLDQRAESETAVFTGFADAALPRSYRLAGLLLGSASEAEDAVGDALERAWREFPRLRDRDRFSAWFDRILVNGCRDRLRRRARLRFVEIEAEMPATAVDPFARILEGDAALRAVRLLGADERIVIVLHYWADLTLDEIAVRLACPRGTVRSRLHRALERLRADAAGLRETGS